MIHRCEDPWKEAFAHFGMNAADAFDAKSVVHAHYGHDDDESAWYIYGWYMYLNGMDDLAQESPYVSKQYELNYLGWLDAKHHYEQGEEVG